LFFISVLSDAVPTADLNVIRPIGLSKMLKINILLIDAIINLILGILLIFFSPALIEFFGVPYTDQYFYPNILGAVLFGIGIALLIECYRKSQTFVGLGLGGAISINLCGGIILGYWLIFKSMNIPTGGKIFLWTLVCILISICCIELIIHEKSKHTGG
jgi:hypothetical protein